MCNEFPGSLVILTTKADPMRPWVYNPEEMGFPCVYAPETIHFSYHLALSRGIKQIVKRVANRRVVHLFGSVSGLNVLRIMRISSGNIFLLANDAGFSKQTRRLSQRLRWNFVGKRCHGVLSPGEAGQRYMQAWGFSKDQIYNSYFSHDVETYAKYRESEQAYKDRNLIRDDYHFDKNHILGLCVSRLIDWKRVEDLAEALKYIPSETQKRLYILLIGDGPYKTPLRLLETCKNVRFKWIPAVSYEEMLKYYAASDFLVLPSEGDIWGLVVNEALSMGKPVICTNRIGASEMVEDGWNGIKVPVRSPEALASAIESLVMGDQLRTSMSQNAQTIEKTWHSGLFIEELKRLTRDLCWGKCNSH